MFNYLESIRKEKTIPAPLTKTVEKPKPKPASTSDKDSIMLEMIKGCMDSICDINQSHTKDCEGLCIKCTFDNVQEEIKRVDKHSKNIITLMNEAADPDHECDDQLTCPACALVVFGEAVTKATTYDFMTRLSAACGIKSSSPEDLGKFIRGLSDKITALEKAAKPSNVADIAKKADDAAKKADEALAKIAGLSKGVPVKIPDNDVTKKLEEIMGKVDNVSKKVTLQSGEIFDTKKKTDDLAKKIDEATKKADSARADIKAIKAVAEKSINDLNTRVNSIHADLGKLVADHASTTAIRRGLEDEILERLNHLESLEKHSGLELDGDD